MKIIEDIREKAKILNRRIVFPESLEKRTLEAVIKLTSEGICKCTLIGNQEAINSLALSHQLSIPKSVQIIDPEKSEKAFDYANELFNIRKSKGLTHEEAKNKIIDPLYWGAMMVRRGDADGCVAGAVNTTGDVLRAGIQVIGMQEGIKTVSSVFIMVLPSGKVLTYGDCAVVPYPNEEQLANIAVMSAQTHLQLTGETPSVAMLSFSTKGSAIHESADKVIKALSIAKTINPNLNIDGEMQFDAAYVAEIGAKKYPNSTVAGKANVMIFPNLDAGNISYKITERLGGAEAIGPIIQGLAKPMNDLSRGCKSEDIVTVAAICALKAGK